MSFQGNSPAAVAEVAQAPAVTAEGEAPTRLQAPATVRFDRLIWMYVVPVAAIHLAAMAAFIPWLFSWTGVALAILGVPFYGMGITLGYHRVLAHRSLVLPKWLEHAFTILCSARCRTRPPSG